MGILILVYHRINNNLPPDPLIVSVEKFQEQMHYLKTHYDILSMEEVRAVYCKKDTWEEKDKPQVVITMDDGYRDNFQNAFPVLKAVHLPATIFLTTGFTGTEKAMRRYAHMPSPDMLSWDEVKKMSENGITFGPHTVTHPHLPTLTFVEQKREITKSLDALQKHLSKGICRGVFSYTYGEYNEDTLKILKEIGIKIALTINPGINHKNENPLELKRIAIGGHDNLVEVIKKSILNKTDEKY